MPIETAAQAEAERVPSTPAALELDDVAVAADGSIVDGTAGGNSEGRGLDAPLLSGWKRRSAQPSLSESFATVEWHTADSARGIVKLIKKAGAFLGVGFLVAVG